MPVCEVQAVTPQDVMFLLWLVYMFLWGRKRR